MTNTPEIQEHIDRINAIEEDANDRGTLDEDMEYLIEQARTANRLRDTFDSLERASSNLIRFQQSQNESLSHQNLDLHDEINRLAHIIHDLTPEEA